MREPDGPSGPDPTADEFDAIVAGWRREGRVPVWPDDPTPDLRPDPTRAAPPHPGSDRPDLPGHDLLGDPHGGRAEGRPDDEPDDHFVPPEPPPLPRLGPPAAVGLALLLGGLLLIAWPELLGVSDLYGLPLGLLALASGLGWLVLRLWPSAPPHCDGDGEDDGAVL